MSDSDQGSQNNQTNLEDIFATQTTTVPLPAGDNLDQQLETITQLIDTEQTEAVAEQATTAEAVAEQTEAVVEQATTTEAVAEQTEAVVEQAATEEAVAEQTEAVVEQTATTEAVAEQTEAVVEQVATTEDVAEQTEAVVEQATTAEAVAEQTEAVVEQAATEEAVAEQTEAVVEQAATEEAVAEQTETVVEQAETLSSIPAFAEECGNYEIVLVPDREAHGFTEHVTPDGYGTVVDLQNDFYARRDAVQSEIASGVKEFLAGFAKCREYPEQVFAAMSEAGVRLSSLRRFVDSLIAHAAELGVNSPYEQSGESKVLLFSGIEMTKTSLEEMLDDEVDSTVAEPSAKSPRL